jgi:hypothetical protein
MNDKTINSISNPLSVAREHLDLNRYGFPLAFRPICCAISPYPYVESVSLKPRSISIPFGQSCYASFSFKSTEALAITTRSLLEYL